MPVFKYLWAWLYFCSTKKLFQAPRMMLALPLHTLLTIIHGLKWLYIQILHNLGHNYNIEEVMLPSLGHMGKCFVLSSSTGWKHSLLVTTVTVKIFSPAVEKLCLHLSAVSRHHVVNLMCLNSENRRGFIHNYDFTASLSGGNAFLGRVLQCSCSCHVRVKDVQKQTRETGKEKLRRAGVG